MSLNKKPGKQLMGGGIQAENGRLTGGGEAPVVAVGSSRRVRLVRRSVTKSLRCCSTGSRCDPGPARRGSADRERYRADHFRGYISLDPRRVPQSRGAFGPQPVTLSEVL